MVDLAISEIENDIPILSDAVPVTMPELPPRLRVTTVDQFRALSDPMRIRILGLIQTQPATAKQMAAQLGATPGAIGHHLHLLEENGLAKVVARRLMRGVVAKYYTRTARLFEYEFPPEVTGNVDTGPDIMAQARAEFADASDQVRSIALPHVRISQARALALQQRLDELLDELLNEPVDPEGAVYGICLAMYAAPAYLLSPQPETANDD